MVAGAERSLESRGKLAAYDQYRPSHAGGLSLMQASTSTLVLWVWRALPSGRSGQCCASGPKDDDPWGQSGRLHVPHPVPSSANPCLVAGGSLDESIERLT